MFKTIFAALLLAASTTLLAQAPQGERRLEQRCAKAKDPKLCEERHEKLKAAHSKARQACEGKKGPENRDCLQAQMCAQAKDPARCNTQAKERQARGDDRRACVRQHIGERKK